MLKKLTVGLFLPRQYEVIADNVKKGDMDLLVYPEAHDNWENREKWEKHSKDIKTPIIIGLKDERGAQLGYFYNPNNGFSYTYLKHSTADYVAFQNNDWSPEKNLKVIELNDFKIGLTICHDMYLSLLMRYLTGLGAEILINPSGTRVKRKKWATILRARAIENRAFTFCTLHDIGSKANQAHIFGFSPLGECIRFTNLSNGRKYTSFETASEDVYITEITKEEIEISRNLTNPSLFHLNQIDVPSAIPRKTETILTCKILGNVLNCTYSSFNFSFEFQKTPVFYNCGREKIGIIPIKAEEVLEPEKILDKINSHFDDCKNSTLVFWNHWKNIKEDEYSKLVIPIILARVIEWCSPFIISVESSSKIEGFEIANTSKAIHKVHTLNQSLLFELSRAWGINSAFKMCKVENFAKFQTILSRLEDIKS